MSDTQSSATEHEGTTASVFFARGIVAIAWAVIFAIAADSLTTGIGVLLVIYPLIDVVGTLLDGRGQTGSARQFLLANAAVSAAAAVALGVAATGSIADVLAVFGAWAGLSGAAQLVVALRRRSAFGSQWPLLLAGGFSVIAGVGFIYAAAADSTKLRMLAIYAGTGGVEFIIQAWLLARQRRIAAVPAHS